MRTFTVIRRVFALVLTISLSFQVNVSLTVIPEMNHHSVYVFTYTVQPGCLYLLLTAQERDMKKCFAEQHRVAAHRIQKRFL
jgi:hypothetical protein